jgi:hypothetical protein
VVAAAHLAEGGGERRHVAMVTAMDECGWWVVEEKAPWWRRVGKVVLDHAIRSAAAMAGSGSCGLAPGS